MHAGAGLTGRDLFPRFSDEEYARRYRAVREAMAQEGLDAIVVSGGLGAPEVHYLANYLAQSPCWLVFPREGESTCLIHFYNHLPCAKAQAVIPDIRWYGPSPTETVAGELHRRGLSRSRIGLVSFSTISYKHFTDLQHRLPEVEFVDFGPRLTRLRWVRSEEELAYLRRSGYLTDLACEALEQRLKPGMTEHDILSIVYGAYIKNGGEPGIHFIATTNMAEPDRFVPWQRVTPRTIGVGSVVITELTVS